MNSCDEAVLPTFRAGEKKQYSPQELDGHIVDVKLVVRRYSCGHSTMTPSVMGATESSVGGGTGLPTLVVVKTSRGSRYVDGDASQGIVINTDTGEVREYSPNEKLADNDRVVRQGIVHLPGTDPGGAMLLFLSHWTTWESWNGALPAIPEGWIAVGHQGDHCVFAVVGKPVRMTAEDVFFHERPHACPRCRQAAISESDASRK